MKIQKEDPGRVVLGAYCKVSGRNGSSFSGETVHAREEHITQWSNVASADLEQTTEQHGKVLEEPRWPASCSLAAVDKCCQGGQTEIESAYLVWSSRRGERLSFWRDVIYQG